jgi:8-oxo-dGTP pyrophosphatase MutT (NUDIX family)
MRAPEAPPDVREAGVLFLLYPLNGDLTFVLTKRTDTVATHKGQVSLPGGAREAVDQDIERTAVREVCEEIGFCDVNAMQMLGSLTSLYINVSDYEVHPYVGWVGYQPLFTVQPEEVARVIEMPLSALVDDRIKRQERWNLRGMELDVPFYHFDGETIWGATAILLSEFEWRLKTVAGQA